MQIGVEGGGGTEGGTLHGFADDVGHLRERAAVVAERLIYNLVGGIHDAGHVATAMDGIEGQLQTAELLDVGLQEFQVVALEEVEAWAVQVQTLGEREGILNGQSHIGHTELRLHASIGKLYGAVHDRLRMDEHLYAVGRNAEEPACLHHLEAFVHECCRVDGDLCAHVPSGVFQGIGSGDRLQLLLRELAEGSTRACQENLFYFVVAFAHQTLEDGRVLAVDGQDGHVVLLGQLADEFTSHDECLLVGQTYLLPCTDGMDGWLKT